jgi:DNA (cytosine-5)-methyltransferase 1
MVPRSPASRAWGERRGCRVRCLELFAGAGGAALGLEGAGMEHAALCEWDPDACATLRAAGLGPVVEGDVRDLDAIQAVVGPSADCLWSSFPCQAFSTAGKRLGAMDERNGWPWTVAALDRFRPRWFLGENVRGLLCHSSTSCGDPMACAGCYFHGVILPQLRERYAHVGWWLLNAADFGVPQHRRRVILWAGPVPLTPPTRTHGPGMFTRPWVSMGEALGLSDGMVFPAGVTGVAAPRSMAEAAGTITGKATAYLVGNYRGRAGGAVMETHPISEPSRALRHGGGSSVPYLLQPSPTVTVADGQGLGSRATRDQVEAAIGRRRLTVAECSRLQDFPPSHPFQGTKGAQYRQVGNAVPPTLARVVAERVLEAERATLGVPAPRTHWDREGRGHGTDPNPDASG